MNYLRLGPKVTALLADNPGWTDAQVTEELNRAAIDRTKALASSVLLAWSGQDGRYARIDRATRDKDDAVSSAAFALRESINRETGQLDLAQPEHAAIVTTLVAGSVLTTADQNALATAATETVSWATDEGLGRVREGHVQRAQGKETSIIKSLRAAERAWVALRGDAANQALKARAQQAVLHGVKSWFAPLRDAAIAAAAEFALSTEEE